MAYRFGTTSLARLDTCHPDIQLLMYEVIKHIDCSIVCGHRDKEDQDEAVADGKSKAPWPTSKHNSVPSMAVDIMPWYPGGIRWTDREGMYFFIGMVKGIATQMGIRIRIGIDWDGDNDMHDQGFVDGPHIELEEE